MPPSARAATRCRSPPRSRPSADARAPRRSRRRPAAAVRWCGATGSSRASQASMPRASQPCSQRLLAEPALGASGSPVTGGALAGYLMAVSVLSLEHQGVMAEIDEFFVLAARARARGRRRRCWTRWRSTRGAMAACGCSCSWGRQLAARAFYERRGFTRPRRLRAAATSRCADRAQRRFYRSAEASRRAQGSYCTHRHRGVPHAYECCRALHARGCSPWRALPARACGPPTSTTPRWRTPGARPRTSSAMHSTIRPR